MSLSGPETKVVTTDKECLVIVCAFQLLRLYLEGSLFTVITGHEALKSLLTMTEATGRLARWRLFLSGLRPRCRAPCGCET